MNNKVFWREAIKAGTIIGLALVGIQLAHDLVPSEWGTKALGWLSWAVLVGLMFGFTRNTARKADPAEGFNYGRCLTFALAMMLFVGFLMGVYQAVAVNTFMHEQTLQVIDDTMDIYTRMGIDGEVYYGMLTRMMFNPLFMVFSQIFSNACWGFFIALITSAFAMRPAQEN